MIHTCPNHALQGTAAGRRGCNRHASWPQALAQERPPYALSDDPTKAWAEVEKVHQALRPPDDWRTHEPTAEDLCAQMSVDEFTHCWANKSAPSNRRPAGQSDSSARFQRDCCRRSASPAAVAELTLVC